MSILPLTIDLLTSHLDSFVEVLKHLSNPWEIDQQQAILTLNELQNNGHHIWIAYHDQDQKIVGTITLLIEPVFWRGGSHAGHIENLVVHPHYQWQGIAQQLMITAIQQAKSQLCYKIILDCPDHVQGFYEKFGFERKEHCMKLYFS